MAFFDVLRRLLPVELPQASRVPGRILSGIGYFRLRTWLASYGTPVPESWLYQPLYSPWEGQPAFDALYQSIRRHTMVSPDRCYVLATTLSQALKLDGAVVECGVFRGGTALLEAKLIEVAGPRPLHLFDSFAGMPTTSAGVDRFREGDFAGTSLAAVQQLLQPYPFVEWHVGLIPQTFEGLNVPRVAWAHIDVDLYQSVKDCIAYFYPRLVPGGYLVFDDYGFPSCPGARRAVDEAFATLPEVPLCLPTGQCLVVKLDRPAT